MLDLLNTHRVLQSIAGRFLLMAQHPQATRFSQRYCSAAPRLSSPAVHVVHTCLLMVMQR